MNMRDSIRAALVCDQEKTSDDTSVLMFRFAGDDPTFVGHFPGRPILPGVFQIEMAKFAAERVLNRAVTVKEVVKAKFLRPIIPEETLRVELKLSTKTDIIQVRAGFSVMGQPAGETNLIVA
jgi:3-hydroxyacyl-[acyl-carrier-protein] dehydratase